jgi:hypothetical protein
MRRRRGIKGKRNKKGSRLTRVILERKPLNLA